MKILGAIVLLSGSAAMIVALVFPYIDNPTIKSYLIYGVILCAAAALIGMLAIKESRNRLRRYFFYWFPPVAVLILTVVYFYYRNLAIMKDLLNEHNK